MPGSGPSGNKKRGKPSQAVAKSNTSSMGFGTSTAARVVIFMGLDVSSRSFVVHAVDEKKRVVKREEIEPTRAALSTEVRSRLFLIP